MTSKRRRTAQAASSAPSTDSPQQVTPDKQKKRGTPGRPARTSRHASQQAKEHHEAEATAIQHGIDDLNRVIASLKKLQAGGDLSDDPDVPRDWLSEETLLAMTEVIDENPRPSLEYVLGVVGAPQVPKRLNERQRNQGARAFTAHLRNRAIRRKREAMEEKRKEAAEKLRLQAQAAAEKARQRVERERKEKLDKEKKQRDQKDRDGVKEEPRQKDGDGGTGKDTVISDKSTLSIEKEEKQTHRPEIIPMEVEKPDLPQALQKTEAPKAQPTKDATHKTSTQIEKKHTATKTDTETPKEKDKQDVEIQAEKHKTKGPAVKVTTEKEQSVKEDTVVSKEKSIVNDNVPSAVVTESKDLGGNIKPPEKEKQSHDVEKAESTTQVNKTEASGEKPILQQKSEPESSDTQQKEKVEKTDTEQKADVKKADVKRADVKKADVKKADAKKADAEKADAKKADAKKADAKKADVKEATDRIEGEKQERPSQTATPVAEAAVTSKKGVKLDATSVKNRSNIVQPKDSSPQPKAETVRVQAENLKEVESGPKQVVTPPKSTRKDKPSNSSSKPVDKPDPPKKKEPEKASIASKSQPVEKPEMSPHDSTRSTRRRPSSNTEPMQLKAEAKTRSPPKKIVKSVDEGDDMNVTPSPRERIAPEVKDRKPPIVAGTTSKPSTDVVMKDAESTQQESVDEAKTAQKPRERTGSRRKFSRFADAKSVTTKEPQTPSKSGTQRPTTAKKEPKKSPSAPKPAVKTSVEQQPPTEDGSKQKKEQDSKLVQKKAPVSTADKTDEKGATSKSDPSDEDKRRVEMEKKSPPRKRAALDAMKSKVALQPAKSSDAKVSTRGRHSEKGAKSEDNAGMAPSKGASKDKNSNEESKRPTAGKSESVPPKPTAGALSAVKKNLEEGDDKEKKEKPGSGRKTVDKKMSDKKDEEAITRKQEATKSEKPSKKIGQQDEKEAKETPVKVKRPVGRPPKKTETRLPKKRFQEPRDDYDEITPMKKAKESTDQETPGSPHGKPPQESKDESSEKTPSKSAGKGRKKEKERVVERRVGSRRFSFVREDPISRHKPQTRLRRESSHLRDPTSLPLDTDPYMVDCYHIWKDVNQDKISIPFREPVQAKDAPGYFDVIKNPMDLSTVLRRIENKTIITPQDFYTSMKLICENAMMFNGRGSDLYELAEELLEKIRKATRPVIKTWRASLAAAKSSGTAASPASSESLASSGSQEEDEQRKESEAESESRSESEQSSEEGVAPGRRSNSRGRGRGGATRGTGRGRGRKRGRGRPPRGGHTSRGGSGSFSDDDEFVMVPPPRGKRRGRGRISRGGAAASGSGRGRKRGRSEEDSGDGRKKRRLAGRKRKEEE